MEVWFLFCSMCVSVVYAHIQNAMRMWMWKKESANFVSFVDDSVTARAILCVFVLYCNIHSVYCTVRSYGGGVFLCYTPIVVVSSLPTLFYRYLSFHLFILFASCMCLSDQLISSFFSSFYSFIWFSMSLALALILFFFSLMNWNIGTLCCA